MTNSRKRGSRPRPARASIWSASLFGFLNVVSCSDYQGSPGPGPGPAAALTPNGDGAYVGQLVQTVARFPDGSTTTSYALKPISGTKLKLSFDEAPDVRQGTTLAVFGDVVNGRLEVDHYDVLAEEGDALPLIDPDPLPDSTLVMALVNIGTPLNTTVAEVTERLFGASEDSIKNYYLENSFGMHNLTGMVMPMEYSFPMSTCDYEGMAEALREQIHTDSGVAEFDIYLWYFYSPEQICGWSGLSSGRDTYYQNSTNCVVLVQEPGHSFGMSHSSRLECESEGAVVPLLDDPNLCTHEEYGNSYDTMGGGCGHFAGYQKIYRTYLQKCNGVRVKASGTYTLFPIEQPCDGIQTLQVPMPKVRPLSTSGGGGGDRTTELGFYTVELRAPIGFDSRLKPSVFINAAADFRFFTDQRSRGEHIWLLDAAPEVTEGRDGSAHALAVGATFTDPAGGVSITTEAVSAESATIRIEIEGGVGDSVCLDGATIAPPGPATCGVGAGGMGGMGGAGGTAGMGGSAGASGAGGAGMGGSTGGAGGSAGNAGTAGAAGTGLGGNAGSGASAGVGGAAGAGGIDPGSGGTGQTTPSGDDGGCSCRAVGRSVPSFLGALGTLTGLVLLRRRR